MDRRTAGYLAGVALAAAALLIGAGPVLGAPAPAHPTLVLALGGLAVLAQHFPFRLGAKRKATAAIGAYFAGLLLFGPTVAMVLTAASQFLGGMTLRLRRNPRTGRRRRGRAEVLFNTSQLTLAVGLAGLVGRALQAHAPTGWAVLAEGATLALANSGLVAVMVGLRRGQPPLAVWRAGRLGATAEAVAVLSLGLATATLATESAWLVPLLALPAGLLQRSLQRGGELLEERQTATTRLAHQAGHDPLTDLPNRASLRDHLARALAGQAVGGVALLHLDLDNFKVVNDSLGHAAGDQLLIAVGRRLLSALRPHDTVARLGADEFLLLLADAPEQEQAIRVAERLVTAVAAPLIVAGQDVHVTASVGVVHGEPAGDPEEWLRLADIALHEAKAAGKARHALADRTMTDRAERRLTLEQELRRALDRGDLAVHYQPKVALATGRIVGWEALARWQHPERGMIAPGAFISLAEETGLILPLGAWVLGEACRQAAAWQRASATPLAISVNLSMRQFRQADLAGVVAGALAAAGLAPAGLELEITESLAMEDPEATVATLSRLRGLGVGLALDDFGSGYSSLRSLQQLPLDVLKVDRSLVAGVGDGAHAAGVLRAIVALGHTLGLQVVAEGVETAAQVRPLRAVHCDLGQGYHFGRPVPAPAAEALLAAQSGWLRAARDPTG